MDNMWVARDRDGTLNAFVFYKPYKVEDGHWSNLDLRAKKMLWPARWVLPPDKFPEVKWSDAEPTEVELIIKKKND